MDSTTQQHYSHLLHQLGHALPILGTHINNINQHNTNQHHPPHNPQYHPPHNPQHHPPHNRQHPQAMPQHLRRNRSNSMPNATNSNPIMPNSIRHVPSTPPSNTTTLYPYVTQNTEMNQLIDANGPLALQRWNNSREVIDIMQRNNTNVFDDGRQFNDGRQFANRRNPSGGSNRVLRLPVPNKKKKKKNKKSNPRK